MKKKIFILFVFIVITSFYLGCSAKPDSIIIEENLKFTPVLKSGEALTIISDKEKMFRDCLSEAIKKKNINLRIIPSDEFRTTVFKGMNEDKLKHDLDYFIFSLKKPEAIAKINEFNLRYIILFECLTESKYLDTGFGGAGAIGGPVFFLEHTWERATYVEAKLVDVKQDFGAGTISTRVTGKTELVTTCLIPTIGWKAYTEGEACKALANKIVNYWANNKSDKD